MGSSVPEHLRGQTQAICLYRLAWKVDRHKSTCVGQVDRVLPQLHAGVCWSGCEITVSPLRLSSCNSFIPYSFFFLFTCICKHTFGGLPQVVEWREINDSKSTNWSFAGSRQEESEPTCGTVFCPLLAVWTGATIADYSHTWCYSRHTIKAMANILNCWQPILPWCIDKAPQYSWELPWENQPRWKNRSAFR